MKLIAELKAILADEEKVLEIIREELTEVKERFNDKETYRNYNWWYGVY